MLRARYRVKHLAAIIQEQGRTHQWIAARAGVSPSLISHALAGRRTLSADAALRLSSALSVDLCHLFDLS